VEIFPANEAETVAISDPELRKLEPVLLRFALRAVRDAELARDLAQDALTAAVAQAADFAGRSTLRTWVVGILSHKIMDHYRRRASQPTDADDRALVRTPSEEDIERVVSARQQLQAVERALTELPEQERLAILLCDVEGVERENCCHVLGVTATHLRVLLHRGRNRLRRMLEDGQG
jgi:RNA polymerase sigma factor (sigma-70 family)